MKILIIGAGIAGPTLNAFLRRSEAKVEVDIIEQASDWSGLYGYSLGIWDNGRDILRKLGLEERFDKEGKSIKSFHLCSSKGKIIRKYNLSRFFVNYGSAYTHLNRRLLHDWLLEKGGQDLVMGVTAKEIKQTKDKVSVLFSTGKEKEYDLVVGADGIHSPTRNQVFGGKNFEHYSQWRAWFLWTDKRFRTKDAVAQYMEPERFVSVFDENERTLCVLLAFIPHDTSDEPTDRIERLKEYFKNFTLLVPDIFSGIEPENITPTDLASVQMKSLYKGRVVLIGDAGHAMEPFAGLGASMAMEDAYVLSGELIKVTRGEKEISDALKDYDKKRTKRINHARRATYNMRWWALSKSRIFCKSMEVVAPFLPARFFVKEFHNLLKEEI